MGFPPGMSYSCSYTCLYKPDCMISGTSSKSNPEKIVHQVPELNKLLGMRHLLKDLRSNIIDNTQFRKELEKILQEKQTLQNFKQELGEATSPCLADGGVA